jgi:hypothetical protein
VKELPPLAELFPFKYQGGGYFRRKGVIVGVPAQIIHGDDAIGYLYNQIKTHLTKEENTNERL